MHTLGKARALDVPPGNGSVTWADLQRYERTIRRQRASHPDGAVTAQRPDLENATRVAQVCKQPKELALQRRHVDRRESGCGAIRQRGLENVIRCREPPLEVLVDLAPELVHGVPRQAIAIERLPRSST